MTGADRTVPRRAAQWLLLTCTVFGLAMMHTLGHAGMQMGHDTTSGLVVGTFSGPAAAAAEPCHGDCPDGGGMTGWSVCMAVFGGLALAVLFAALLWLSRRRTPLLSRAGVAAGPPRSPPISAFSVLVRSTTVLRI